MLRFGNESNNLTTRYGVAVSEERAHGQGLVDANTQLLKNKRSSDILDFRLKMVDMRRSYCDTISTQTMFQLGIAVGLIGVSNFATLDDPEYEGEPVLLKAALQVVYTMLSAVSFTSSLCVIIICNNLSQLALMCSLRASTLQDVLKVEEVLNRRMYPTTLLYIVSMLSMLLAMMVMTLAETHWYLSMVMVPIMLAGAVYTVCVTMEDKIMDIVPVSTYNTPSKASKSATDRNEHVREAMIIQRMLRRHLTSRHELAAVAGRTTWMRSAAPDPQNTTAQRPTPIQGYLLKTASNKGPAMALASLSTPEDVWSVPAHKPATKRWYVLHGATLSCYRDAEAYTQVEAALAVTHLDGYEVRGVRTIQGELTIALMPSALLTGGGTVSADTTSWYLCHSTEDATYEWLSKLRDAAAMGKATTLGGKATTLGASGGAVGARVNALVTAASQAYQQLAGRKDGLATGAPASSGIVPSLEQGTGGAAIDDNVISIPNTPGGASGSNPLAEPLLEKVGVHGADRSSPSSKLKSAKGKSRVGFARTS